MLDRNAEHWRIDLLIIGAVVAGLAVVVGVSHPLWADISLALYLTAFVLLLRDPRALRRRTAALEASAGFTPVVAAPPRFGRPRPAKSRR